MEDCVHTRGLNCVQRLKRLQNLAAVHNLEIIDNSQPSCTVAPWILVRTHKQEVIKITFTWEGEIEANGYIHGLTMEEIPQVPGEKIKYKIWY